MICSVCGERYRKSTAVAKPYPNIVNTYVGTVTSNSPHFFSTNFSTLTISLFPSPELSMKFKCHDHGSSHLRPGYCLESSRRVQQVAQPLQRRVVTRMHCNQWISNVLALSLWIEQPRHLHQARSCNFTAGTTRSPRRDDAVGVYLTQRSRTSTTSP